MSAEALVNFASRPIGEIMREALAEAMNPPQGIRMPWWPKLHELTGGFRPHELTILCAPTGAGKTEFLANIAAQNLLQGTPQFCAPVETGDRDFANRIMGILGKIRLNAGEPVLEQDVGQRVGPFLERLEKAETHISTFRNRVQVSQMIDLIEWHVESHGAKIAVLDNLNFFLEVTRSSDTLIEMDRAVHEFVIMSQRLPVHTILVMHPKKTDGGRVESEFDIKGSSTAVQECDNVLLFNRPKPDDVTNGSRSWGERELVFKKIRKRGWNINKPIWMKMADCRYGEVQNEIIRSPSRNHR